MDNIVGNWKIGDIAAIEPISSYWGKTSLIKTVDGRCFILKEKADLLKTEQESLLLNSLWEVGAPVAVPVRTKDSDWYALNEGKIFCLYPQLPGEIITEHYSGNAAERAKSLGNGIGLLHACLLKCDGLSGFEDMQFIKQIQEWAIPCIQKYKKIIDGELIEKIWGEIKQDLESLYADLPNQLIHRDPNPSNILFDKAKVTGFVDFEMVARGPRIFDVCYCGTSLLISGFPDPEKIRKWPTLFHSLLKGYQEVFPLTSAELSALYGILAAIEIIFAAFSLETKAEGAARCNANVLYWLSENKELIEYAA